MVKLGDDAILLGASALLLTSELGLGRMAARPQPVDYPEPRGFEQEFSERAE